jgi:hypothetical protein
MAERFDIGSVINKKMIAASKIYELLLKADVFEYQMFDFCKCKCGRNHGQA